MMMIRVVVFMARRLLHWRPAVHPRPAQPGAGPSNRVACAGVARAIVLSFTEH